MSISRFCSSFRSSLALFTLRLLYGIIILLEFEQS
nr:MAG TPA: hypothetical protein [Caudoviricetes sp.]